MDLRKQVENNKKEILKYRQMVQKVKETNDAVQLSKTIAGAELNLGEFTRREIQRSNSVALVL